MSRLIESLSTLPKILTLTGASVISTVTTSIQAQGEPHWAQVFAWVATGLAALLAGVLSTIRLVDRIRSKTLSDSNNVKPVLD